MKKGVILLIFFLATNNIFADEIDDMINKINNKREAKIPKKVIETVPSPMPKVIVKDLNGTKGSKSKKKIILNKELSFALKGIMNDSANINGKWIKKGEEIGGYKLVDVMEDSVYLQDGNKSKMLFFEQNISKIKIQIGR